MTLSCPMSPQPAPSAPTLGVGLRRPHLADVMERQPVVGFFEVHPENYMLDRPECSRLEKIREDYPLSLHSVGLSLGSAEGVDERHLDMLAELVARLEPDLVSDHVSWSTTGGAFLNDLLPLPYTRQSLDILCRNISHVQDSLGRQILVENPSLYASFESSEFEEADFLNLIARRTGCALLLDVNNVAVSAHNLGFDPDAYLNMLAPGLVGEIHVAGHTRKETEHGVILIDDHGSEVSDDVWALYQMARAKWPEAYTLLEWDSNLPDFPVLLDEAKKALLHEPDPLPTAPAHDLPALQQTLSRSILTGAELPKEIKMNGHFSVNANNVAISLRTVLESTYPVTKNLAGEDYFRQCVRRFIAEYPPSMPCVAGYGAAFPDFLNEQLGIEYAPYLPDIARLEWAVHLATLHEHDSVLSPDDLEDFREDHPSEQIRFRFQPGVSYLRSLYPIDLIWEYARNPDGEGRAPDLDAGPALLEVSCYDDRIRLRRLDEASYALYEALHEGKRLGDAAGIASSRTFSFSLYDALNKGLMNRVIASCTTQHSPT